VRRLYRWFQRDIFEIPGRVIAVLFFLTILIVPLVYPDAYLLRILTIAAIFSIFAASWDLLSGFTGQVSLGHGLFFGVSAYAAALLSRELNMPICVTIPLGGVLAAVVGTIVCIPAFRLRGFYLGLVTLALPIMLIGVIFLFPNVTGGELGIYGAAIAGISASSVFTFYIVVFSFLVSILVMWKFTDTRSRIVRTGLVFHAIREDEITARASGIRTWKYKLLVFMISGFFAGIAGGFYAHFFRVVGPSTLELFFSFQAIVWTIFGGMTTIYGPVVGVFILYPITELLTMHPVGESSRFIIQAFILVFVLLFMPEGIATWVRDHIEKKCPRCKLINSVLRQKCRACHAELHLRKVNP